MTYLETALIVVLVLYSLWVHFLAVMKLRDIRDEGKLVGPLKYFGFTVLFIGYAFDMISNVIFSVLMLNPPGIMYITVSAHTKYLALNESDYWRGKVSLWLRRVLLAPADKSGGHD